MAANGVVVLGGSRGIGQSLVRNFAAGGLKVCGTSRQGEGPQVSGVEWLACDVTDPASLESVKAWLNGCAGTRMVVQCAADAGPIGPIETVPIEDWWRCLEVNVFGLANALHVLLPTLGTSDFFFTFLGGGMGGPAPLLNSSAYMASKSAAATLIEVVARRQTGKGPSIIGISPGSYPTALARSVGAVSEVLDEVDASRLAEFLLGVAAEDGHRWSGRCLSANRDVISDLLSIAERDPDSLRMRRVDGSAVIASGAW